MMAFGGATAGIKALGARGGDKLEVRPIPGSFLSLRVTSRPVCLSSCHFCQTIGMLDEIMSGEDGKKVRRRCIIMSDQSCTYGG